MARIAILVSSWPRGAIQRLMRPGQFRRHGQWVVKISERGLRELFTSVQHALRGGLDGLDLPLTQITRPGVIVINDVF